MTTASGSRGSEETRQPRRQIDAAERGQDVPALLDRVPLESERSEVESAVTRAATDLKIPVEIVTRHTGIAPVSLASMPV